MKKIIFILAATLGLGTQADVLSLRGDVWCPFNCKPGSSQEGFLIDIAKEIFTKAGHTVDYKELNWSRTLQEVREGKLNVAVGASKEDAKDLLLPKEHLSVSQNCFFGREDEPWSYTGPKSLESKKLAIANDYTYGDEIDGYINKNKNNDKIIDVTAGDDIIDKNVKKVTGKRVDILIEDKSVVGYYLLKNNLKLKNLGCLKSSNNIYLAFSAKNPKSKSYVELFDKSYQELKKSGQLAVILKKYGM